MSAKYSLPSAEEMSRMYMHGDQIEETIQGMRRLQRYLTSEPHARRKCQGFLRRAGILGLDGKLTPPYRAEEDRR